MTENQGIFDCTDLEKEIEEFNELKKLKKWDFRKGEDCVNYVKREERLAELGNIEIKEKVLKERQRLKAEVEKVLNDYEENWGSVIQSIKKRLGI